MIGDFFYHTISIPTECKSHNRCIVLPAVLAIGLISIDASVGMSMYIISTDTLPEAYKIILLVVFGNHVKMIAMVAVQRLFHCPFQ